MQHEGPIKAEGIDNSVGATPHRTFRCKTGGEGIRDLLKDVSRAIVDANPLSDNLGENAQVVLAEVLNNIEEHGYEGRPGCQISLDLDIREDCIMVETTDFGSEMPGLQLPTKTLPDAKVTRDNLPEGGFGWFLIHTLAPNPVYKRRGNSNILKIVISAERP